MNRYFRDDEWGNYGLAFVVIEPGCDKSKSYNRHGKLSLTIIEWDLKWLLECVDLNVMREITESEAKQLIGEE